jgi:hypothetical protein
VTDNKTFSEDSKQQNQAIQSNVDGWRIWKGTPVLIVRAQMRMDCRQLFSRELCQLGQALEPDILTSFLLRSISSP